MLQNTISKITLTLGLTIYFFLSTNSLLYADCTYKKIKGVFTIVCTGTTTGGLAGSNGKDSILITDGAELICEELDDGESSSEVSVTGIDSGNGKDIITNNGTITVHALSEVHDSGSDNTANTSAATATGIAGGNGKDVINNSGTINVTAEAARSEAKGINGGSAKDEIINTGTINVSAISTRGDTPPISQVTGDQANLSNQDITYDKSMQSGYITESTAMGIEGGKGNDVIYNVGSIVVNATSKEDDVTRNLTLTGTEEVDTTTTLDSIAVGIDSDDGNDKITNAGTITTTATSEVSSANSANIEVNLFDTTRSDTSTFLYSTAKGIDAERNTETINNTGVIAATANSKSSSFNVEVNAFDLAVGDSVLKLDANAVGIDAEHTKEVTISNSGTIKANANSEVSGVGVNVSLFDLTFIPELISEKRSDSSTMLNAAVKGINGGRKKDEIVNYDTGLIESMATSKLSSTGVSISSEGAPEGVPEVLELILKDSLADVSLHSFSHATGIDSDKEDDRISNLGMLTSSATSSAEQKSISFSIDLDILPIPFDPGIAVSNAGTHAQSTAVGIDGGEGEDKIINAETGSITVHANAVADAISASVVYESEKTGVAGGAALANASTTAEAKAVGIDSGEDDDKVLNEGVITVGPAPDDSEGVMADALAVSFSLDIEGTTTGVAGGAALVDASATGTANSIGINGGEGDDKIINAETGSIMVNATSDTDAAGVSGEISDTVTGVAGGAALANASTTAEAKAVGIDSGEDDDEVLNEGSITVGPAADDSEGVMADALAVSFSLDIEGTTTGVAGGAALVDASATGTANSIGINGGEGDDKIINAETGSIMVNATSDTDAAGVSGEISDTVTGVAGGAALANASTTAEAKAVGIDSGEDDDEVLNEGSITVGPTSEDSQGVMADALAVSFSLDIEGTTTGVAGGAALVDASATGTANSIGINGGEGDDKIINAETGSIMVNATSDADAVGVSSSFSIAAAGVAGGAALANASTTAEAKAVGIDSGEGDDEVLNEGSITVGPAADDSEGVMADALAVSVSVDIEGTAAGVAGGAALVDASATGRANAVGIDGGKGEDKIINAETGSIMVNSTADVDTSATAVEITGAVGVAAGVAYADARTTSASFATGIDGGAGKDSIYNYGNLNARTTSKAEADSRTVNVNIGIGGGESDAFASTTSEAFVKGIDGGNESDLIINTNTVNANAKAETTSKSSSWNLIGVASAGSVANSNATSIGISGGDGADSIYNEKEGEIKVNTISQLSMTANSKILIGKAQQTTVDDSELMTLAESKATGIDGGNGDDILTNRGTIILGSSEADNHLAKAYSNSTSWDLAGVAETALPDSILSSTVKLSGMDGSEGNDTIINTGTITLGYDSDELAMADTSVDGSSWSFAGYAESDVVSSASADSTGIVGGAGMDDIHNEGTLQVFSTANLLAESGAKVTFGDSKASGTTTAEAIATGIDGGNGGGSVTNLKSIEVLVRSTGKSTINSQSSIFSESESIATATSQVNGYGVKVGDGNHSVRNYDEITVSLTATGDAHSEADGDWLGGNASATSEATVVAHAVGIETGDGDNMVTNSGDLTILTSNPTSGDGVQSIALSDADGDGLNGNGWGKATATVDVNVRGIYVGNGYNTITNSGELTVNADPYAKSTVKIDGDNNGNAIGITDLYATAVAIGIETGRGGNKITNSGVMTINAKPEANSSRSIDEGWLGSQGGSEHITAHAKAKGILTGNGNNEVINAISGIIDVRASDPSYCSGSTGCEVSIEAIGIQTGSGDDTIINKGMITTTIFVNGGESPGVGIDSNGGNDKIFNYGTITAAVSNDDGDSSEAMAIKAGDGNDKVLLGDESLVDGSIYLGPGDDELTVIGTASVTGVSDGGDDMDTLTLEGATNFDFETAINFESTVNNGNGTTVVTNMPTMEKLRLDKGTLQIQDDYEFSNTGTVQTQLFGDGTAGQLAIENTATLAGTLSVVKGNGAYIDDTTYTVLKANSIEIDSKFDEITLPDASPLLSFDLAQQDTVYKVKANTESFTTVASNPVESSIAGHLDNILPAATGDLADSIGELQGLQSSEFSRGFSSLNPGSYDSSTNTTFNISQQYVDTIQNRMYNVRSGGGTSSIAPQVMLSSGEETYLLVYSGSNDSIQELLNRDSKDKGKTTFGLWLNGFGQWGDRDEVGGHTGFDFSIYGVATGFDHILGDNLLAGLSIGYSNADVDLDGGLGDGDIKSTYGSVYASYFNENMYAEAVLSYGKQDYNNNRNVVIGSLQSTARSDHDAHTYSAFLSGGYNLAINDYLLQPFASLKYAYIDEDGFEETGAGSLNLIVDKRKTDSLDSELGLRIARTYQRDNVRFIPEVSVAWTYAIDIDDRMVTASFMGAPNSKFTIDGADIEKHGALLGAGMTLINMNRLTTSLRYNAELRKDFTVHGIIGDVRYEF